jgi:hypothetical protein
MFCSSYFIQIYDTIRRGKVFALTWVRYDREQPEGEKEFAVVKVDWHCVDYRQPWNFYVTSRYAMVQGFTYKEGQSQAHKWRGLLSFHDIKKIQPFPRKHFDQIR